MSASQQELLARYNEHTARRKAHGETLANYKCPFCLGQIECSIPRHGQVYDSMVECPFCEKLHFKTVYSDGAVFTSRPVRTRRASAAQRGFSLVGLLASLVVYVLLIGGIALLANALTPAPPTVASPRYTVTIYETRINGQRVTCAETHDHQTGARERAC